MKRFYFGQNLDSLLQKGPGPELSAFVASQSVLDGWLYDDFDGSLEKKNYMLIGNQDQLYFMEPEFAPRAIQQRGDLGFADSISDLELQSCLDPILTLRRLLALEPLRIFKRSIHFVDLLHKTVVRMEAWSFRHPSGAFHVLQPTIMKGYEKPFQDLIGGLERLDWQASHSFPLNSLVSTLHLALRSASKPKLPSLSGEQDASHIVPRFGLYFLNLIRMNEWGVLEDYDTEFLHDLRVASRKSRSILKLLKKTVSPELVQEGEAFLKDIGKNTNELRDLDVYLLERERYLAMLKPERRPHLQPFFDGLQQRRTQVLQDVRRFLTSETYLQGCLRWKGLLGHVLDDADQDAEGDEPLETVSQCAQQTIRKRYLKIRERGLVIAASSQDEEYHQLRIECKKVRYLLDLFMPLYPEIIKTALKKLKSLQNLLGEFNDLSVQEDYFQRYCDTLQADHPERDGILMAVGMLLNEFFHRKEELKTLFENEFEGFLIAGDRLIAQIDPTRGETSD